MAEEGVAATTTTTGTDTAAAAQTAAPAAFDWSKAGLDDLGMAKVTALGWKGPADVVTSFRNLESVVGVPPDRIIKLPAAKEAGDPKAWDPIFAKLGRPETPDKYVVPVPEGDKGEFAAVMKPIFHKAGLSQSAVTAIATEYNAIVTKMTADQKAAVEQRNTTDIANLKQAWGGEFDAKAAIVDRAADAFGMKQEHLDALKSAMGPKAAMEFLYSIGSKVAVESTTVPGITNQQGFGMSPEAAQAKIQELRNDPSFAKLFNSKDAKQRMEARNEMSRLNKIAYPGVTPFGSQAVTT